MEQGESLFTGNTEPVTVVTEFTETEGKQGGQDRFHTLPTHNLGSIGTTRKRSHESRLDSPFFNRFINGLRVVNLRLQLSAAQNPASRGG